jgi:hypothetical protein
MRRTLVGLAGLGVLSLILGGCAGSVLTEQASNTTPAIQIGPPGQGTAASNHAAARRDAATLLTRVRLPAGVVPTGVEPRGDHGYLKLSGDIEGDSANALTHAWWTTTEPAREVLAYVKSHTPAGASQSGTGSVSDNRTGGSSEMVGFDWPAVNSVLGDRELQVTVSALTGGRTGILAEAQSDWVVPRSPSERVPAAATTVRVTLQQRSIPVSTRKPVTASFALITAPQTVLRAVRLVDSLPVVQPVAIMCPLILLTGQSLTVTYNAGPAGPALARAQVSLQTPSSGGADSCDPILFSIRGLAQTPLISASFVRQIETLAGFRR